MRAMELGSEQFELDEGSLKGVAVGHLGDDPVKVFVIKGGSPLVDFLHGRQ